MHVADFIHQDFLVFVFNFSTNMCKFASEHGGTFYPIHKRLRFWGYITRLLITLIGAEN